MLEAHALAASAPRPVGAGLRAAQRVVLAAERAAAAGHGGLCWAALRQWPEWAAGGQPPAAWLRTLGASWRASELQQCIDGARLNQLCEDLGAQCLQWVLQLDTRAADTAPATRLPHAGSAAEWRETLAADGRSVALASLADPALRAAVAASLGWPLPPQLLRPAQAQAWLAALPATPP